MKFLIAIEASLLLAKQSLGFIDVNINTATFEETVVWEYRDPTSRQALGNVANNTAYNFRHSDQNLFIENDVFTAPSSDRTYDTARNYVGKYFKFEVGLGSSAFTMPLGLNSAGDILTTEWLQLTTSFQALPFTSSIQIRALDTGGFTIRVTAPGTRYLLGSVTELRKVTGA